MGGKVIEYEEKTIYKRGVADGMILSKIIMEMLKDGLPISKIAQYTSMSIDEANRIVRDISQGIAQAKMETVIEMLKDGLSISQIAQYTSMSIDEVSKIAKDNFPLQ